MALLCGAIYFILHLVSDPSIHVGDISSPVRRCHTALQLTPISYSLLNTDAQTPASLLVCCHGCRSLGLPLFWFNLVNVIALQQYIKLA